MESDSKKMFALTEAKDLLIDINNAISKTREKSWQLLAFLIATNVYLVTTIIEGKSSFFTLGMGIICLVADICIGQHLYFCMFPNKIYSNGGYPEKINETIKQENNPNGIDFYKVMITNYSFVINENALVLKKMTEKYKNSLIGLMILVGSILLFTVIFFVLVKLNKLSVSS